MTRFGEAMHRSLHAVPRSPVRRLLTLSLAMIAVAASALLALPRPARAQGSRLDHIKFAYWGGPLIQRAKIITLFWGSYWSSMPDAANYFNGFFQALFLDGRYLLNLQQYSAGGYQISNGQLR